MNKWELEAKDWRGETTNYGRTLRRLGMIVNWCQHLIIWHIALFLILYVSRL